MALSARPFVVVNVAALIWLTVAIVVAVAVVADSSSSSSHKNELYENDAITDDLFTEFHAMAAHLGRNYAKLMKRCRHNIMSDVRDYERVRSADGLADFEALSQGVRAQLSDLFDVGRDLAVADRRRRNDFIMMTNVLLEQNVPPTLRSSEPIRTILRRMRSLRDGDETDETDTVMQEYRQNCWRLIESVLRKAETIGLETRDETRGEDGAIVTPLEDAVDALFEALLIVTNEEWARSEGDAAQLEADYRKLSMELSDAVEALQLKLGKKAEDEL